MELKTKELSILAAVAHQCAEARRPISSLIVMAACNARAGIEQDRVLVHLASLKRQGYVTQDGERWEVTVEGHKAARQAMTQAATPSRAPSPIPEKPPVRPKSRDTLRPMIGGAPKPVTRPEPAAVKESFTAATPAPASPGPSSTACDDQELADPWTEGSEMGVTHICPDTRRAIPSPRYAARAEDLALGRKHDTEKPRVDLLLEGMPRALEEVSRVLTFGSIKYEDHNWKYVSRAPQRYLAAGLRHELAVAQGESRDPESGFHHLAHAACCLLFRLELALEKELADD